MALIWSPGLDSEALGWQGRARQVAIEHAGPLAAQIDCEQRYPQETVGALYSSGIATMFVPTRFGGAGASLTSLCAVVEELAQACASTSGIVATLQLGATPLIQAATPEIQSRYLGMLVKNKESISFALSESNAGSDPSRMQTTANAEKGGWRIRGEKRWIGGAGVCTYYLVFAQTEIGSGRKGIAAFIVDAKAQGVDDTLREDKMGMRGTVNSTIKLDTWVATEALIALPGKALRLALETLNVGRVVVAAQSCGIALAAFHAASERASTRQSFGVPLISHQGVGFQLADIATRISASRMLTYESARMFDHKEGIATIGAQAKLFSSETAHDAVDVGVQVFGGEGYVKPSLVERLYRDQRATEIYEGTSEIQRLILMRAIQAEFEPKSN